MLSRIARSGKTRFESYVCGKKHIHQHNTRREVQSYVHGACNVPLMFSTTGEVLRKQAESRPDKEFLVFRDQNVRKTFANVYEDARRLAAGFLSLGLQKGDRVGVWGHNYYEWTMVQYATAIAGMIQVNINPSYTSSELLYALQKVGVKALVTPKSFKQNDYYSSLMEICPTMARGEPGNGAVSHRELPDLKHIIVFGEEEPLKGAWAFNEILNGGGSEGMKMLGEVEWTVLPDDPVNIQYTSGTTGYPKAATLTHHNILNNAYHAGIRSKFDQQEHKICVPNPLYHCFGCVLGVTNALTHAQTCVFPAVNYQIKRVFEAIQEEKCTFLFGTPTMFIDLLSSANFKDYDLSSLKGGYIAGAPCPPALCEAMVRDLSMDDMYILYGSTECSPLVTMSVSEEPPMERIKSVGNVMPHVEAMVVDPEGKCVDRGVRGELWARGYMTMRGYWADEEKTKKDLTADHWYHSGDTAYMTENGSICIVGRTKDMICRGGENIYPTEIEQFMHKLAYVADVQVVGVPDERFGEVVCAWVRLRDGHSDVTPEKIKEDCKGKISHFKVPKYVLIKEEKDFPLTATGKVKKFELKEISKKLLGLENVKSHFSS